MCGRTYEEEQDGFNRKDCQRANRQRQYRNHQEQANQNADAAEAICEITTHRTDETTCEDAQGCEAASGNFIKAILVVEEDQKGGLRKF